MATDTKSAVLPLSTRLGQSSNAPMVQNFQLIWLDGNIDETNDDYRNSIAKLREVVNTVKTFTSIDECIRFIDSIKDEKVFMISSGVLGQAIVPLVHSKSQLSTIYIFCGNKTRHELWATEWSKIGGVYTDIIAICIALKQGTQDCDHNSISISFIKKSNATDDENIDILDCSFMYTQILKEILLTIEFKQEHINEFLRYCRKQFVGNKIELKNIDKIEEEYHRYQPIWWYTYECFLYSMLNRALRTMEVDLIIKLGFFVHDLHNDIAALHSEQYAGRAHSDSFNVYRGQGLSRSDFDQLQTSEGGLLAFNNFLSTSKNYCVSLDFARRTTAATHLVAVLFVIQIDPSVSATPFANIKNVSYLQEEEEILFSMHSIFRIGQMKQIEKNNRLWQVDLTLTSDHDPQLQTLTKSMRQDLTGQTGWARLGQLMIKLGQFEKAQQMYEILLSQASDARDKADIYYRLGWTKDEQGEYKTAMTFYEKSIETKQLFSSTEDTSFGCIYNNMANTYMKIGEFSKALSFYTKALQIYQRTLPENHRTLAISYNNMGSTYTRMGDFLKALSHYEKALRIKQKILPENHPSLATSYNNIGNVYRSIGEYSKALSYYEEGLHISEKTLPANHPDLATSYNNIGSVYENMIKYSKALSNYEHALEIFQHSLPPSHPNIQLVTANIARINKKH